MREFYSKAIVLDRRDSGEVDGLVSLFTQDYGKIVAFAKSVRKPKSKLSSHLQPLTFIKVRFIQRSGPKDGWAIIDCLRDDDFLDFSTSKKIELIPIISFLDKYLFEFQSDRKLWEFIKLIFSKNYKTQEIGRSLVNVLGFDYKKSACLSCGKNQIEVFSGNQQAFFCRECFLKLNKDNVLYLENN